MVLEAQFSVGITQVVLFVAYPDHEISLSDIGSRIKSG